MHQTSVLQLPPALGKESPEAQKAPEVEICIEPPHAKGGETCCQIACQVRESFVMLSGSMFLLLCLHFRLTAAQ